MKTKIEEWKPKDFESIQPIEENIPGITTEQINAPTSVKNIPGGVKAKVINIQRDSADGTGQWLVSGIGFKPAYIRIQASYFGGGYFTQSDGSWTEGISCCKYTFENDNTNYYENQNRIIDIELENSEKEQLAYVYGVTDDGFILDFTTSKGDFKITMIITCIG